MSNNNTLINDYFESFEDYDISFEESESPEWNSFIDEVVQGNVIPVIGPEVICEQGNPHQRIIDYFVKYYGIRKRINSFSELINDLGYVAVESNKDNIYLRIDKLLAQMKFQPSTILKEILNIKQFRFVITTSFTPVVEDVMREIWGDELRVMKFNNNPQENQDVISDLDLNRPTVYYMFGKVCNSAHRYVITDTDMLEFGSSWVAETNRRPKNLVNCLKDKYLLMIGNCYSDWLFRFIWYSLRKSGAGNGLYAYETVEDDLSLFLLRNKTFLQNPTRKAVDIMRTKLSKRLETLYATKFDSVEYGVDIFISYSRSDSEIAEKLYLALKQRGKNVWYDKKNISVGGKFMDEIRRGIRKAKYFIPILTENIIKERNEPHAYRNEWDEAIEVAISLGRNYMLPVCQKNIDFYQAAIPDKIRQCNVIMYDEIQDIESVADKIVCAIG